MLDEEWYSIQTNRWSYRLGRSFISIQMGSSSKLDSFPSSIHLLPDFSPFPSIHFVRSKEHDQILQYYHQHDNRYFCHMSIFLSPLFPYFAITIFPCKRVLFKIHLGRCNVALQMTSALQPVPLCWERCHFSKTPSMTRKIWLLFQSSPQ